MDPNAPVETTAVPASPDAGGLTPEEMRFFENGDTTQLPPSYAPKSDYTPPPQQQAAPTPPAPQSPPADTPPPPAPAPDYARLMAEQQSRFEQQMRDMQTRLEKATAPPEPQGPDEYTDPIGAQLFKLDKLHREMEQLRTGLTQQQQQAEQTRQLHDFVESVKADKAAFTTTTPDFPRAYEHIRAVRTEDLRQAGCPEADIPKVLLQDELQFANAAKQRGQNAAEQMYAMAKRYGYAATAAPPAPPARDPVEHVQRLQNGQFASKQPAHAAPTNNVTLESLKDAGAADLDKVIMNPDLWDQVVGGQSSVDIFHRQRH